VLSSACVRVCLFLCTSVCPSVCISQKAHAPTSRNFLNMLPMAGFHSDDNAIH